MSGTHANIFREPRKYLTVAEQNNLCNIKPLQNSKETWKSIEDGQKHPATANTHRKLKTTPGEIQPTVPWSSARVS